MLNAINGWPHVSVPADRAALVADVVYYERLIIVFSCLLLLILFRMGWGRSSDDYASASQDFAATFDTLVERTQLLSVALYLAMAATILVLCTSSA